MKNTDNKNTAIFLTEDLLSKLNTIDTIIRSAVENHIPYYGIFDCIGHSLVDCIFSLCEAALKLVCFDNADPEGTIPFPTMKDLADWKKECPLDIPAMGRIAAKEILDIRKCTDSDNINLSELVMAIIHSAMIFLDSIEGLAKENSRIILEIRRSIKRIHFHHSVHLEDCFMRYRNERREIFHYRMNFIMLPKDEDEYSDEELDKIYKLRNRNTDKHIAPVYIMEIMMKYSSEDHKLGVKEVTDLLKERYCLEIERKAVSRTLRQLQEADFLCTMYDENGYWYDAEMIAEYRTTK